MEFNEIQEGFLLICNELQGNPSYPQLMELYNRAINIEDLQKNGLIIDDVQYDIDLIDHIDTTKLELDKFVQQDLLNSDAVVQGHRKITSAFASIKKLLIQQDQQQKEQPLFVINEQISIQKPKLLNIKAEKENLDEELQEEIFNISQRMKYMATEIQEKLKLDNKLIDKIASKQENSKNKLQAESQKLGKLLKSKSLSCSSLFLMLVTSLCLFIFAIIFIRLF